MRPSLLAEAHIPANTFRRWLRSARAIGSVCVPGELWARSLHDPEVAEVYFENLGQLVLFPAAAWRPARYAYAEVRARLVRRRATAVAARAWAARDLGVAPPRMRFFVPLELAAACGTTKLAFVREVAVDGLADHASGEIWIDVRLPRRKMVEIVAHEVKHIAQASRASELDDSPATREAEAERYGRRVGRGRAARRVHGIPRWRSRPG